MRLLCVAFVIASAAFLLTIVGESFRPLCGRSPKVQVTYRGCERKTLSIQDPVNLFTTFNSFHCIPFNSHLTFLFFFNLSSTQARPCESFEFRRRSPRVRTFLRARIITALLERMGGRGRTHAISKTLAKVPSGPLWL